MQFNCPKYFILVEHFSIAKDLEQYFPRQSIDFLSFYFDFGPGFGVEQKNGENNYVWNDVEFISLMIPKGKHFIFRYSYFHLHKYKVSSRIKQ